MIEQIRKLHQTLLNIVDLNQALFNIPLYYAHYFIDQLYLHGHIEEFDAISLATQSLFIFSLLDSYEYFN